MIKIIKTNKQKNQTKLCFYRQNFKLANWMQPYLKKNKDFFKSISDEYEKLIRIGSILDGTGYEHDNHHNKYIGEIQVLGTILTFNSSTILGISKFNEDLIEFETEFKIIEY